MGLFPKNKINNAVNKKRKKNKEKVCTNLTKQTNDPYSVIHKKITLVSGLHKGQMQMGSK